MAAPCVLIGTCTEVDPQEIVKGILLTDELAEPVNVIENIQGYDWHIDTKYYIADIQLCTTKSKTIGDAQFATSVEAVILVFSCDQASDFDVVKSWLPFVKVIEPAISIILCNKYIDESVISRSLVQKWCLENGFELIELHPLVNSDTEEDDFADINGIQRVRQALHAHTWPNLLMKDKPMTSSYLGQLLDDAASDDYVNGTIDSSENQPTNIDRSQPGYTADNVCRIESKSEADVDKNTQAKKEANNAKAACCVDSLLNDDMALIDALGDEDLESDNFEMLFERMKIMKEKATSLPPEQRKKYAEKVAISFWKALGGDEEEIQGLSDSD